MMDIDLAYLSQSDSEIVKETKEKKKKYVNLTVKETKERKRNKGKEKKK